MALLLLWILGFGMTEPGWQGECRWLLDILDSSKTRSPAAWSQNSTEFSCL